MKNMKSTFRTLALQLLAITAVVGCATEPNEPPPEASCEGASSGLGALSCSQDRPVNASGSTPEDLATPLTVHKLSEQDAAKNARTYTGACTGIWQGCSRVAAEGWTYEVCGSSLYAFMTFDGAYGNLTGYGIVWCLF